VINLLHISAFLTIFREVFNKENTQENAFDLHSIGTVPTLAMTDGGRTYRSCLYRYMTLFPLVTIC